MNEVFEPIRIQTFQDYGVVVVNSSQMCEVLDLIKQYGFKEVRENVRLLKAQYLVHKESEGDYELLLGETRALSEGTLELLLSLSHDMAILGEEEIGGLFLIKLANLDRKNIMECNTPDAIKGFALPRLFKREILGLAFERLKENLGEIVRRSSFPNHELKYYQASKVSNDVFVLKEKLIKYYGDSKLLDII